MDKAGLIKRYQAIRVRSVALAASLSDEDCCVQSMPDASPIKWHLGHTTWFFETFILESAEPGFQPVNPAFRVLFNSYYNAIGDKHPRPRRGLLTRPGLAEIRAYRQAIDERLLALLLRADATCDADTLARVALGLHHEQQHQELMLTDLKHLFSCNPLAPAYRAPLPAAGAVPSLQWLTMPGGLVDIGHDGKGFAYDNEGPRHRVWLAPYQLASRLVCNAEYAEFIAAGGYRDPSFWLAEGWDWQLAQGRGGPAYWRADVEHPGQWCEFTLSGLQALDPARPVVHLSYYEADAYARWAGARLPTEAEWENAAVNLTAAAVLPTEASCAPTGHFADRGDFHPAPAVGDGLCQMFGDAWEWTASSYSPYPGFVAPPGAVGEYNGKFMVNQYVLRGGSCVTPENHIRATYRNFFPANATWQFSGLRLAR